MRDTQQTFFSDNLLSTFAGPRLTYYEVCLTSDNTALAGQHTSEIADLSEAFASIFDRCKAPKVPALDDPRGSSTAGRL